AIVSSRSVILLFAITTCAAVSSADVIHLKNGRKIWADHVRQEGTHLRYDVGDDSYAIPESLVERVEEGGVPPEVRSSTGVSKEEVPSFVPNDELQTGGDLPAQVLREGHVDNDALASLERTAKPEVAGAAYFVAGKHEFETGNLPQARGYFDSALRLQPGSPTILNYYAALLVRMGSLKQALSYAQRSVQLAPNSADSFAVLGVVQFASDRSREAIRSWKRSLELRPDAAVEQYIAKAEREIKAESAFSERASSHFTLHYEGKQTSDNLRRSILMTLESEYDDLVRELGASPRESIPVVLYTEQAYFDVTQAPAWSGALNDGKLRIPVSGLDSVTPDLARVLKHELAHSFINQLSHGRCPQWLHEGIAQAVEPRSLSGVGQRLAQLFQDGHEIPFYALEGSFARFSSGEAALAYAESLAAVQYIQDTYGLSGVRQIVERIGEGSSTEQALRGTVHSDYARLQNEVGGFLKNKYNR
ncbi:MAG: peptidase MA family metallohydrolase, partial [Acidobacteriota bacterium]